MHGFSPLLAQLITAFKCLPGVGQKSAQRMAFQLLERDRAGGRSLASALQQAIESIGHCSQCRNLTESPICSLCDDPQRQPEQLCIVESPADVIAIENTHAFKGRYFVLMGKLSPLDGIGPEELGIPLLAQRFDQGHIKEIILATNATVEGEATAHYLSEMAQKRNLSVTRLAHGIPVGGELEYIDSRTLSQALLGRKTVGE